MLVSQQLYSEARDVLLLYYAFILVTVVADRTSTQMIKKHMRYVVCATEDSCTRLQSFTGYTFTRLNGRRERRSCLYFQDRHTVDRIIAICELR